MVDKQIISKVADIPLAKPGYDALNMTAPMLMQLNPQGKWENASPCNLDEERLKKVVEYLVKTKAVSAAQSYCCQCAAENKIAGTGNKSNYVPIIMMPIYPADECPFDMDCEIEKMKESAKPGKPDKKEKKINQDNDFDKEKASKKPKKRGFVMQRLTDFDLLSQW